MEKTYIKYLHGDDDDFYNELIEDGFSEEDAQEHCQLFYEVGIKRGVKDGKAYIIGLVKK